MQAEVFRVLFVGLLLGVLVTGTAVGVTVAFIGLLNLVDWYKERMAAFVESERLRRELEAERDKLRRDVALWRDRSEDMRKERDDAESERDYYKAECKSAQATNSDLIDSMKNYIELPKGEDGEHIHIGDVMYDTEHTDEHAPVVCMLLNSDGWAVSDCNAFGRWKSPQSLRHHSKPDPIEETFREYELGNLTSSEAIEKIREATNVG